MSAIVGAVGGMMERRSFTDASPPLRPGDPVVGRDEIAGGGAALAHRSDFAIGRAMIRPSTLTIEGVDAARRVEPRVMRVLVALHAAGGAVLGRDDLRRLCWDGVVVGDDALNRAIAELRRAARDTGAGFGVETIARVGYRLTGGDAPPAIEVAAPAALEMDTSAIEVTPEAAEPPVASDAPPGPALPRRALLAGGAAILAAAGSWAWLRPRADPRVEALVLSGAQALRDEWPDSAAQGAGFLREALAIDPANARAWGLLAMAERNAAENAPPNDTARLVRETEAAAARALALDARQPDALAALAMLRPVYGDWLAAEDRLRAVLAIAPDHATTLSALGIVLESVGRSGDSKAVIVRAAATEPLSPVHQYRLAYKHWFAGEIARADQVIDRAVQLWPLHPSVWFSRLFLFAFTGRPALAARHLADAPDGQMLSPRLTTYWRVALEALATRAPAAIARARAASLTPGAGPGLAIAGVQVLAALGEIDGAFQLAEGYLLRRGPSAGTLLSGARAVHEQRWRKTLMLFTPASVAIRADARFAGLCREIGLADYWRRRGVRPDYLGAG